MTKIIYKAIQHIWIWLILKYNTLSYPNYEKMEKLNPFPNDAFCQVHFVPLLHRYLQYSQIVACFSTVWLSTSGPGQLQEPCSLHSPISSLQCIQASFIFDSLFYSYIYPAWTPICTSWWKVHGKASMHWTTSLMLPLCKWISIDSAFCRKISPAASRGSIWLFLILLPLFLNTYKVSTTQSTFLMLSVSCRSRNVLIKECPYTCNIFMHSTLNGVYQGGAGLHCLHIDNWVSWLSSGYFSSKCFILSCSPKAASYQSLWRAWCRQLK